MSDNEITQEKTNLSSKKNNSPNNPNNRINSPDNLKQGNNHDQGSSEKPDIILLVELLPAINKAGDYLKQILNKLALDAETVAKMPYSFTNSPRVWNLKQAKENLDILVINAILRNPQQIKYKEWIVELALKKPSEAVK